jgi:spermidine synthase
MAGSGTLVSANVKKWNLIDKTQTADGKTISLHEHDGSYTIRADNRELMSTRQHASEERLAVRACAHVRGQGLAHILIGGLGFGFTLRAALAELPEDASVVVAEILPAVIEWNRNPSFPFAADALADPRVAVRPQDVVEVIEASRRTFDSIILDVDNGPNALTTDDNFRLYDYKGLDMTRAALRPRGCLALWSAAPDPIFERLMAGAGFDVSVERCRSHGNSGTWCTLFLGRVK